MLLRRKLSIVDGRFAWLVLACATIGASPSVAQTADLTVAKTASPVASHVGSPLTYTVTATNNGPSTATSVKITDPIPFGTTFKSATASQGSCTGTGTVSCSLGSLLLNQNATVTITVVPGTTGTITNTAKVAGTPSDPNLTNNTASVSTVVTAACTYSISPQQQTFSASGGSGSVSVATSDSSCTWRATTAASWITIISGLSGTGNGTVTYSISPNSGGTRTGTMLVAGFTVTVVQAGKSAPIQFSSPVTYGVGSYQTAIVAADFNNDGKKDIATYLGASGQLAVLLATGTGTFAAPVLYNLSQTTQLIAADVNEDGYLDLLALNSGSFAALLNDGKGGFSAPVGSVANLIMGLSKWCGAFLYQTEMPSARPTNFA